MEQRIGSNSQPQPLEGAGSDPAFIPGLTAPAPGVSDGETDTKDETDTKGEEDVKAEEEAEPDAAEEPVAGSGADASPGTPAVSGAAADSTVPGTSEPSGAEPVVEGPVFEVSDRRAGIVADHEGIRLRLDDQACEFRWDEIGAVETETARFGKRYTVTVHTAEGRWYPIEIEATSRGHCAVWETELDAVLDSYFDDRVSESRTAETDTGQASPDSGAGKPGADEDPAA